MSEHRLTFRSSRFYTDIDCSFDDEASWFNIKLSTQGEDLFIELSCPGGVACDDDELAAVEREALAVAKAVRRRLQVLLIHNGGDCGPDEVRWHSRHHPPPRGTHGRMLGVGVVIGVGQPTLRTALPPDRLSTLVGQLRRERLPSPAETLFLDSESVPDPIAKLILLWSGLGLFCDFSDDEEHQQGRIDEFLLKEEPSLERETVVRKGKGRKPLEVSAIRAARDRLAHLGEKDPAGLERSERDARRWAPELRRIFARLLVTGPRIT